jgi:hypothetical protein
MEAGFGAIASGETVEDLLAARALLCKQGLPDFNEMDVRIPRKSPLFAFIAGWYRENKVVPDRIFGIPLTFELSDGTVWRLWRYDVQCPLSTT